MRSETDGGRQTGTSEPGELQGVEPTERRRFEVDGAEVWTRSALKELPETATKVEVSSTVIDSGNGPELCMGNVMESLPPKCAGPVVDGLQMGSWTTSRSGVTWGERTMILEWPPLRGRLTLISDRAFDSSHWQEPEPLALPSECESIDRLTSVDVLNQWAAAHPDQAGLVYVLRDGHTGVLGVTGDPEAVRAELRTDGVEPCVIEVDYSRSELEATQEALRRLFDFDIFVTTIGSGSIKNRVSVSVLVADASTVRKIVALVDDPGILSIEGISIILDGE